MGIRDGPFSELQAASGWGGCGIALLHRYLFAPLLLHLSLDPGWVLLVCTDVVR